jgi:hypothetical protein
MDNEQILFSPKPDEKVDEVEEDQDMKRKRVLFVPKSRVIRSNRQKEEQGGGRRKKARSKKLLFLSHLRKAKSGRGGFTVNEKVHAMTGKTLTSLSEYTEDKTGRVKTSS